MKIIIEGTVEEIQALMQKSSAVNRALVINGFLKTVIGNITKNQQVVLT